MPTLIQAVTAYENKLNEVVATFVAANDIAVSAKNLAVEAANTTTLDRSAVATNLLAVQSLTDSCIASESAVSIGLQDIVNIYDQVVALVEVAEVSRGAELVFTRKMTIPE